MKKMYTLFLSVVFSGISSISFSQWVYPEADNPGYDENCTTIMVGRLASSDGSVMTSHSCDGNYRTWLDIIPPAKHEPGTMHPVYWGTLHTEEAWDMSKVTKKGEIPEAEETFAYLSTAYPCMNEKQLAIGETTIYGRQELRNEEGLFLIEELEKIALQRCSTARQAIALMGKLAEEHGYADLAECLTVADPKEVWHFEIAGSGKGKPSALWCAQRIPDDHAGVCANIPRISTIDFNNPDMFMYSSNLKSKAKELGFWDGKEPLKFWKVINGRKPFAIRDFYVLSTLAPSMKLSMDAEELPFSVKPEKKLSVQDVMKLFRETYEGTEWDMTKNLMVTVRRRDADGNTVEDKIKSPVVNNWMNNDLRTLINELKPETIERQRTIAIAGCSYSHVIQCRSWLPDEVGGVAWFSFDNPGQSPRIPIFAGVTKLPYSFTICGQHRYRTDAALWAFREANRLSTVNWTRSRALLEPAVLEFETKALSELPVLENKVKELVKAGKKEEAKDFVTSYTASFAGAAMLKWQELKTTFWGMYGRGF
ncbi:MAG TPA: C69 family dipeptidase [Bacteroidales bacterium]|nr:C69 family dipeptidase [Bacteroidales bacterium]HPF02205.1 C69 family dipeptidase [Bacteroidales bacterium]HPJ59248.1 C69 family dipeptidase [Bacteroidales bacterium]HPR11074.1 C69 family dipeptidase [Bacteroidales bacterium]HRW86466.1 C69 family dipeptidase [Bacteroidales bacterium]